MNLKDIGKILDAEVIAGTELLSIDIEMACACDLMSDVLAFGKSGGPSVDGTE